MIGKMNIGMLLAFVMTLQGCVATGQKASQRLVGLWQSEVGGFRIVIQYTETTVKVGENEAVGYEFDGNELKIADGGSQVRVVSFPRKNRMVQVDPITGTSHEFTRVVPKQ